MMIRVFGRAGSGTATLCASTAPYFGHSDAHVMPLIHLRKFVIEYCQTRPLAGRSVALVSRRVGPDAVAHQVWVAADTARCAAPGTSSLSI